MIRNRGVLLCGLVMMMATVMADERDLAIQKKAKEFGVDGQVAAGITYYEGSGVPKNYPEAMKWFLKAANQGNADAAAMLGMMYEAGEGVASDSAEALKWYRIAAKKGNKTAQARVEALEAAQQATAEIAVLDTEMTALEKEKTALEKELEAMKLFETGAKYLQGEGVPQSMEEAAKYFRLSADKGSADAAKAMKLMFEAGAVVLATDPEALKYFRDSPKQTDADVFYMLGMSYDMGIIPDKGGEAKRWLRKAADLGHQEAKTYLQAKADLEALKKQ